MTLYKHIIRTCFISCLYGCTTFVRKDFTIGPEIKKEVLANINTSKYGIDDAPVDFFQIYNNNFYAEFLEDGDVVISTLDDPTKMVFKSWYYFNGDTLAIEGAFGLFSSIGFYTEVIDGNAIVYHMVSSDDFPTYSYNLDGTLIRRLEVPSIESRLVMSSIPSFNSKETLYGYAEFTSSEYFFATDTKSKKSQQVKMKIYFKADYFDWQFENSPDPGNLRIDLDPETLNLFDSVRRENPDTEKGFKEVHAN